MTQKEGVPIKLPKPPQQQSYEAMMKAEREGNKLTKKIFDQKERIVRLAAEMEECEAKVDTMSARLEEVDLEVIKYKDHHMQELSSKDAHKIQVYRKAQLQVDIQDIQNHFDSTLQNPPSDISMFDAWRNTLRNLQKEMAAIVQVSCQSELLDAVVEVDHLDGMDVSEVAVFPDTSAHDIATPRESEPFMQPAYDELPTFGPAHTIGGRKSSPYETPAPEFGEMPDVSAALISKQRIRAKNAKGSSTSTVGAAAAAHITNNEH